MMLNVPFAIHLVEMVIQGAPKYMLITIIERFNNTYSVLYM